MGEEKGLIGELGMGCAFFRWVGLLGQCGEKGLALLLH